MYFKEISIYNSHYIHKLLDNKSIQCVFKDYNVIIMFVTSNSIVSRQTNCRHDVGGFGSSDGGGYLVDW